jgi:hypothetical protein
MTHDNARIGENAIRAYGRQADFVNCGGRLLGVCFVSRKIYRASNLKYAIKAYHARFGTITSPLPGTPA